MRINTIVFLILAASFVTTLHAYSTHQNVSANDDIANIEPIIDECVEEGRLNKNVVTGITTDKVGYDRDFEQVICKDYLAKTLFNSQETGAATERGVRSNRVLGQYSYVKRYRSLRNDQVLECFEKTPIKNSKKQYHCAITIFYYHRE